MTKQELKDSVALIVKTNGNKGITGANLQAKLFEIIDECYGLTGPTGPAGLDGLTGPTGPVGATGPAGSNGLDGSTGPAGPAGSNGLDGSTGPAGATGPQGEQGIPGATGPQGATGPAGSGSSLTFSTGLTNTSNVITSNLSTGISGGQTAIGGTASGGNLTLSSTSNATKGKILFGTSAYDEVNNRLGIGTSSPSSTFHINHSGEQIRLQGDTGGINFYRNNNINAQGSLQADAGNFRMILGSVNGLRLSFWTEGVERMHISGSGASNGNVGFGDYTLGATARLELPAGTASVYKAPLKFLSGTNLTTPERGAVEYNGTNLFFTRTGSTRENVLVGNDAATPPTDTINPVGWAQVVINGVTYKIPLYQ